MMFSSQEISHKHSLQTLTMLDNYGDFKGSIRNVLDIGCGKMFDLIYWADLTIDEDEGSRKLNIYSVGLDKKITQNSPRDNIELFEHDFNTNDQLPFKFTFDVVWCHDVLQYAHSPIQTLRQINQVMSKDSMLYLCVPSTINTVHNQFKNYTFSQQYNTFTLTQIIYLLALNGFDVKDAYFKKNKHEDCIEAIVYKNSDPLDYDTTWYQLAEKELLSENMSGIVNSIGYLTDNGLVTMWLNGEVFDYRYHT